VLVSTHYMDEAERCHRISYISYGHMLATGTVEEVVRESGLHTFVVRANPSADLINALLGLDSVTQVAPFGATLHVVGLDPARMAEELGTYASQHGLVVEPGQTSLEDVFIHFMGASNGAPKPARAA
jgi:ABC-2 type transport system ATP-binding protein